MMHLNEYTHLCSKPRSFHVKFPIKIGDKKADEKVEGRLAWRNSVALLFVDKITSITTQQSIQDSTTINNHEP
jgi:hypothetical protein